MLAVPNSAVGYVSVGFGECKHKPHLPASLGFCPTLLSLKLVQIQLRSDLTQLDFSSGRGAAGAAPALHVPGWHRAGQRSSLDMGELRL